MHPIVSYAIAAQRMKQRHAEATHARLVAGVRAGRPGGCAVAQDRPAPHHVERGRPSAVPSRKLRSCPA